MELLGRGTINITSLSPASNLLFLLENIPPESVSPLVKFLVGMGLDVNQKAHPLAVKQNALYPTLFTTNSTFANGDPLTHVDLKLKVWIRAQWLHFHDEITGNSITPLRWAIAQDKPALVQALLETGAEFPKIPDKNTAKQTQLANSWSSELCNVFVLDQPCYNIRIVRAFLDRHGSQQGQAPFAETPLGLIVMEPNGPPQQIRMVNYGHPDTLSSLLSLLRQYQPLDDPLLFWAAVVNNHKDIVRYLVRNGVQLNIIQFLLRSGADARATTSQQGLSTIHMLFWTAKPQKTESMQPSLKRLKL
ncbi:hypothetical protein BO83DRAFT_385516 [Aspergillus eucalypticola CBS 122712]|uniref:Ankyrin n=1 Tax=Aspergillus eucalypticola (strain CBS 122712 / IBT 29274) TaxID=1448314 RepID=A0A317W3F6_ASPEC|nr:uncharacterized protein BO83DRAFT_385516 [Aspergillus eucalypticola CBS 122712]PWY81094.1 hypothetical protein BO83DRAFT_385516 [Aspergillus eucalypticola CBS 122712]